MQLRRRNWRKSKCYYLYALHPDHPESGDRPLAEVMAVGGRRTHRLSRHFAVLRPSARFLQQVMDFSYGVHFSDGHLNRRTKEMLATYVSGLNRCPY
jgi:hypothetical protein